MTEPINEPIAGLLLAYSEEEKRRWEARGNGPFLGQEHVSLSTACLVGTEPKMKCSGG